MYFTPSELERRVCAFRNSLQKRILLRGKSYKSDDILRKLSILSALGDTEEILCDTAETVIMILATAFSIKARQGELFTFSISGGGYHFVKRKMMSVIVAYCAALADGFIEIKIKFNEIILKFNSQHDVSDLRELCQKTKCGFLRVRENNACIVNFSIKSAKVSTKSECNNWSLQSYLPDTEAIISSFFR